MKTHKYIMGIALGLLMTTGFLSNQLFAQDTNRVLDEVIIMDSRVSNKAPLTTSTINREELSDNKTETSIPYMLETQPSVVVSGENGKVGATSMRIRGVDATRINVNINGIPLNDPETQAVFWYNIPHLGDMAQSIQIQRGVGASNGGTAAFGGALNLQTRNANSKPYGTADISYGAWNTRQYGISGGTGITKHGFSFDVAYNGLTSDGFLRNGWCDQQSLFASLSHYGEKSIFKAVVIAGSQHTGITWNGASEEQLLEDPTYNDAGAYDIDGNTFYYDNESDNYNQRHYQLYYSYLFNDAWSLNVATDFTHGDGYYEQYKAGKELREYGLVDLLNDSVESDLITRKHMFNSTYTGTISARYTGKKLSLSFGETVVYLDGHRFGDLLWCRDTSYSIDNPEWYRSTSNKLDATTYAKMNYDFNDNFNMYADLQFRYINYKLGGQDDEFVDDHFYMFDYDNDYYFFSPKIGLNYRINDNQRAYFVAGISNREPNRSDIKERLYVGADSVRPETMLDIELGYQIKGQKYFATANAYAMLYKDQLTPSGDRSDVGYTLMENVDKSYRLGIELMAGYKPCKWFSIDGNLTLSMNKIIDYVYTDFEYGVVEYENTFTNVTANTDLSYSPSVVGAFSANFEPVKNFKLALIGKYVGEQYIDNTSRETSRVDDYFVLNFKAGYTWELNNGNEIEAQFVINNLLNHDYRLPSWASDGDWWDGKGTITHIGYLQQPGINCLGRLIYRF